MVEEHRVERHAWELLVEAQNWETERAEFIAANPGPTFKARLIASRRPDPPEVVSPFPEVSSVWDVA